jgi:polyisoprenoid-binding protein YceI
MKRVKLFSGIAVALLLSAFTVFQSVNWKVKNDYEVKCEEMGFTFKGLKATILFDEAHPERSVISADIDARTVSSHDATKTMHLKEQLQVNLFPTVTFISTSVTKKDKGYEATGKLMLHGVSKEIKLPFVFSSKATTDQFPFVAAQVFSGRIVVNLKDFNLVKNAMSPTQVVIKLTVPVVK